MIDRPNNHGWPTDEAPYEHLPKRRAARPATFCQPTEYGNLMRSRPAPRPNEGLVILLIFVGALALIGGALYLALHHMAAGSQG